MAKSTKSSWKKKQAKNGQSWRTLGGGGLDQLKFLTQKNQITEKKSTVTFNDHSWCGSFEGCRNLWVAKFLLWEGGMIFSRKKFLSHNAKNNRGRPFYVKNTLVAECFRWTKRWYYNFSEKIWSHTTEKLRRGTFLCLQNMVFPKKTGNK